MLSKSQARAFFIVGTSLFSLIFLGLTVDTMQQVPKLTNQDNLSPEAIRGKHLFDTKNCMGCHTILGEGGYYAPELTKVYDKRGAVFIDLLLQDPEALFPGERRMPKYDFTPEQRQELIAFFKWIGEMNTQGFPKEPPLGKQFLMQTPKAMAENARLNPLVSTQKEETMPAKKAAAKPAVFSTLCVACHSVSGQGGTVGPALDGVSARYDKEWMKKWLLDPQKIKPGTTMPKLPLSETDLNDLVEYLGTL